MWIIPFVFHELQYNDYYAANPPVALSVALTVVVISQSTVNCWAFNIKEKPWRHSLKDKGSLVPGRDCLRGLTTGGEMASQPRRGGGKSKGVMKAETRFAYRRRDEETAARASEIDSAGKSERRERSWWDEMEDMEDTPPDGMSPLVES